MTALEEKAKKEFERDLFGGENPEEILTENQYRAIRTIIDERDELYKKFNEHIESNKLNQVERGLYRRYVLGQASDDDKELLAMLGFLLLKNRFKQESPDAQ